MARNIKSKPLQYFLDNKGVTIFNDKTPIKIAGKAHAKYLYNSQFNSGIKYNEK
jgi:hypothetical protein